MEKENELILWPGWKTVGQLGGGSFGTVYRIERELPDGQTAKAALKVISIPKGSSDIQMLRAEGYDDQSITNTFKEYLNDIVAEYTIMSKMKGTSNIVDCDDIDYKQHNDGFGWDVFIKMELLTPLTEAFSGQVSDEEVIHIGTDICKALILCKKYDIVHRDIKPANIFLSPNGDYKLGDFGIAKAIEKTTSNTMTGTPDFMAPEVFRKDPYGSTVDICSLGLVLYWLLNGRRIPFLTPSSEPPTISEREAARKRRFRGEEIPAPAHGSKGLQRVVLKACAFNPSDRFQSAEDMMAALQKIAEGDKVIDDDNCGTSYDADEEDRNVGGRGKTRGTAPVDDGNDTGGTLGGFKGPVKNDSPNDDKWVCKKCGAKNSNRFSRCSKCGASRSGNGWIWALASVAVVVALIIILRSILPHPEMRSSASNASSGVSSASTQTYTSSLTSAPTDTPSPTPASTMNPTSTPAPAYAWSEWSSWSTNPVTSSSTREVETRQKETVTGYHMVLYVTRRDSDQVRFFRDYSVDGQFSANGLDQRYGERFYEKSVTAAQLDGADAYPPDGSLIGFGIKDNWYGGLQVGSSTAYNFGDDNRPWFVANTICDYVTEYRHRDLIRLN